jgi:hypothetical protein
MKLLDDTLKKPNGKWDKQSLQMFLFTILTAISGLYVVASDYFLTKEINPYAIGVVGLFGGIATGQAIINVWNKKVDKNLDIDQYNNNEPNLRE